jgi:hypothetical protein
MFRTSWMLLALPAVLTSAPVAAGTSSLGVSVQLTLLSASGVCGSAAGTSSISVACVRPGSTPGQTETSLGNALSAPGAVDPTAGTSILSADGGNYASVMRRLTLLPSTVLGTSSAALYSSGATVGGFRTITAENGSYVEITIEW